MCGIVGYISLNNTEVSLQSEMQQSLHTLRHRGPDVQHMKHFGTCALGHSRLSIIDTSQNANQPFSEASEMYWIVFNGEIFNYIELKSILEKEGVVFKTHSDTEVLLHLLIKKGAKALPELNGFFSFCFYDKSNNSYIIARDRFGVKPLVYTEHENAFIFASEIKALLPFGVPKVINKAALVSYFQYSYIPEPECIFEKVYKLLPGHYIELNNGALTKHKYYDYYQPNSVKYNGDYEGAKKNIYHLLSDAVNKRMISDVPIGAFLSGGVDSSIISLLASKHTSNLLTFSLGFKDQPFFDETKYANLVAQKIKSNHTVFSVSNSDLLAHFETALDYFDEPFADSSALNMFILSKYTKNKITVALSGDGADELFSGYNKHKALFEASQKSLKNHFIKHFGSLSNYFPQSRNSSFSNKARQLSKYHKGLQLSDNERYFEWAKFMNATQAQKIVKHVDVKIEDSFFFKKTAIDDFNDYLFYDFNLVLPNDMLKKVDAMSMANSLEIRTPFLDYRLVDFVFSLSSNYKIDRHNRKKILKDTFCNELPNEIMNRGKQGFEVPLHKWFTNELKTYLLENVFNRDLIESQNVLNWEVVAQIKQELFSSNPKDSVYNTWALLSFQRWYLRYFV